MFTVLVSCSVRCASGSCQIPNSVRSKLPWCQVTCFEASYGDVSSLILWKDQIWKILLVILIHILNSYLKTTATLRGQLRL